MKRCFLMLFVWSVVTCGVMSAQQRQSPELITNFTIRQWRAQDGLPDQTVQAVAQTRDGYLWVGTKGGLLRFDGARFTLFDDTNTPGLPESSINCLTVSRDGSLWIGTEGGGLARYRDGLFQIFPLLNGTSDSFVRTIFEDSRGAVWVGGDQGLFQVKETRLQRIDNQDQIPTIFVRSLTEDVNGNVWVGGTALLEFKHGSTDGRALREFPLPGGPSLNLVTALLTTADGNLLAGTLSGLYRLSRQGELSKISGVAGTVQTLREIAGSGIWIGTLGHGVYIKRGNAFFKLRPLALSLSNTVLAISCDTEKNVWVGTPAGLLRLSRSPEAITLFPKASDSQFETIYEDHDGSVWAASSHLFHLRDGSAKEVKVAALPNVRVRTLLRDRQGDLWIGTDGAGLCHLLRSSRVFCYASPKIANDFIRVILQSRDGSIWVGTDGGLSHIAASSTTSYNTPNGLAYFSVTTLLEDKNGDLWIGTSRGLSHLRGNSFVSDPGTAALAHEKVWSIHEDADGCLWFGTSSGLFRLNQGRLAHLTTAQGLASNIVYQILEDRSSHLWLSSPTEVSRVDRRELEAYANQGGTLPLRLSLYPISQDFDSAELYGGMQPAGFMSSRQEAWFPSNKGPIHIEELRSFMPPHPAIPVQIESVAANGIMLPVTPQITIPPGDGHLEISFAAILLRSQLALRYRFKLEGFDRNWSEAIVRRAAYYTNLPPGRYRFRVAAFETSNPGAISEASIEVIQQPRFFRTHWFALACLGALALGSFGAYRLRMRQISLRFKAVMEERNRMAREMHDTVIQDCIGLSSLLEAISSTASSNTERSDRLVDQAREQVRVTIDEARSAVWNLRHNEGESSELSALVCEQVEQMRSKFCQASECRINGEPFLLPRRVTYELFMIVREALWNAYSHAHPATIEVHLTFAETCLLIEVRDNGQGFDANPEQETVEPHYGVIGMRERAQRIGSKLKIMSILGEGTVVRLLLHRSLHQTDSRSRVVGNG